MKLIIKNNNKKMIYIFKILKMKKKRNKQNRFNFSNDKKIRNKQRKTYF